MGGVAGGLEGGGSHDGCAGPRTLGHCRHVFAWYCRLCTIRCCCRQRPSLALKLGLAAAADLARRMLAHVLELLHVEESLERRDVLILKLHFASDHLHPNRWSLQPTAQAYGLTRLVQLGLPPSFELVGRHAAVGVRDVLGWGNLRFRTFR